ncbi:hypothetical protein HMPREF3293_00441 [Christensenella minuta]|uniref:Uncharacterized protein n=1 Tax=Christensenella minuta TaxID=626937 RepID=A0A136Q7W8_9FIRM|nr:hypothetical protein HMPREF3293_00441 [Christensenella minuta]
MPFVFSCKGALQSMDFSAETVKNLGRKCAIIFCNGPEGPKI